MKKERLISCLILIGIVLALPSVLYIIQNQGNISGYSGEYFYIIGEKRKFFSITGALIYIWSLILMFIVYIKLIKKSNDFKNIKNIIITSIVVGITFMIILPNTSKDVFYYMGNGRVIDKYGINPYKNSILEIESLDKTDTIIKTVGSQSEYRFVYGPVFLTICGLLNKISCSSVLLFLYEFKIINFIAYLITISLIYKLTKKKKLAVVFAFNPLVLLEVVVNVHNDIWVILFALFGFLFIKEAEKNRVNFLNSELLFICSLVFFALSACIKYIVLLILPFIILYRLRNQNFLKKVIIGMVYLVVFLGIFFVTYIPYFNNPLEAFLGALLQSGKLKDSIYLIVAIITKNNADIVSLCFSIGFYVLLYRFIIRTLLQCFRKNDFRAMMENSYKMLLGLIFIGLTNLTSWYLLWLFIPIFWTSGKSIKNIIFVGFLYELTYIIFYITHSDDAIYQVGILPFIGIGMIIRKKFQMRKRIKVNDCVKGV